MTPDCRESTTPELLNHTDIAVAYAAGAQDSTMTPLITVLEQVGSTNTWLTQNRQQLLHSTADCHICAAEQQTSGRGRGGKTWLSPRAGVTFSLHIAVPLPMAELSGLSLMVGASVCDVLRVAGVRQASVKWPNDILVNGLKLCGVLIEVHRLALNGEQNTATSANSGSSVIIGIGINYQLGDEADRIDQRITDLSIQMAGRLPSRSSLIGRVAAQVALSVVGFSSQTMRNLVNRWHQYDAFAGQQLTITLADGETLEGSAAGIAESGHLRVNTANGGRQFDAAEVQVRPRS